MTQGVARLKELLFDSESRTIADLDQRLTQAFDRVNALEGLTETERQERAEIARRLDKVFETAGTRERFGKAVADVLDEALREAEVQNHEDVAQAMAPLVVQTIRMELRNSQDELVEVLYPITGRMVRSYVASAMRDLVRDLNRRVERNGMMLRIRSMASGKSVAELAIAESQHLKVEEIFLIRRGSGALAARWPAGQAMSNSDVHMSGVVSAINDFATHAFQEDGGNLRTFELDDFTVYLRASPVYLVAAKCRGIAPSGVSGIFDDEFLSLLERIGDANGKNTVSDEVAPRQLSPLAAGVEEKTSAIYAENDRAGLFFSPLKALLFVIAVPLFAAMMWWGYVTLEREQVKGIAESVVSGVPELAGYPTTLDVGYRGRNVTVSGLAPDKVIADRVNQRLTAALPEAKIATKLAVLPKRENVDQAQLLAGLRSEIAAVEAEAMRRGIEQAMERTRQRLAQTRIELDRISEKLDEPAQRQKLSGIKANVTRLAREVETYTAVARTSTRDLSTLQRLSSPLHGLSLRIDTTATSVAALVDGSLKSATPSHAASPPSDVSVTAEYLEAQAQRLATTAIAVSQTLLIKPPPSEPSKTTPLEALQAYIQRNVIFFANGTDFRDAAAADAKLNRLAELLSRTDITLRVAGYTDETGGAQRNNPLAQSRADKVVEALVAKGVNRGRLISIGRANAVNLSNITGPTSANRRVQFEVGFEGEPGGE